ncbi:MAG: GAF domain-containing protein [Candidatus Paceibacterota bacterium]
MQTAPIPADEGQRIEAVHRMGILDTKPEERFDLLTKEAVRKLKAPMVAISILDSSREWFKSCQGMDEKEGQRDVSFCGHALLAKNLFIVEDTLLDIRFKDNPMVIGAPFIRFYAGVALLDYKTNQPIGVFCIKDTKPRRLSLEEVGIITDLADRAEKELNHYS